MHVFSPQKKKNQNLIKVTYGAHKDPGYVKRFPIFKNTFIDSPLFLVYICLDFVLDHFSKWRTLYPLKVSPLLDTWGKDTETIADFLKITHPVDGC